MLLIKSPEEAYNAIDFINGHNILAFDIETTGTNPRLDSIIGFGCSSGLDGFYVCLATYQISSGVLCWHPDMAGAAKAILNALKGKQLLMHNGSFDTRFTLLQMGVDLVDSLHCDTMLLKHTCDEDFPFGLKEIATKLWGVDAKAEKEAMLESIKRNGGKATEYYKADAEIIAKYCVQDCLLTYRIYNHYSKDLRRQNMEAFFYHQEVMPLLREVTIPMELSGVQLDMPLVQSTHKELVADIEAVEDSIQKALEPHLKLFRNWFLNKDYPRTTRTGKPSVWTKKFETAEDAWRAGASERYMFNLQSKHHLKKLFFDTLGEEAVSHTDLGNPQVDDEFLDKMASKYAWAADLQVYNKLKKLEGTYVSRLRDEAEDSRFYPSFAMHRTVSGRYAGDFQQFPRPIENFKTTSTFGPLVVKYTNVIRRFIIPSPGNKLCSADYNQLEPSIFAHCSGDPALQSIFNAGKDFYSEVAIMTEGLEGVSSDKKAPNYLGKVDKAARQRAKAYSLGIAYGMTGYKLQFEIGVTQDEADQLVQNYLQAFPKLRAFMDRSKEEANFNGAVRTELGRTRHLQRARQLFQKYGSRLADSLALWKAFHETPEVYKIAKEDRKTYINLINNSINFKIQGLAASVMNRAAIALARKLVSEQLKTRIIGNIHDELLLDVPQDEIAIVGTLLKHIMENTTKLSVPLATEPQFGTNYAECK